MKKTFMRRSVAAVASAGLLLVGIPLATPANAAVEACALGATCEGNLAGSLGASPYKIRMPEKFNGTVLIYSHGYRFGTPVPAAFAGALGLTSNPAYSPTTVPGLAAAGFGVDTAFVGNNTAEVAPNDIIAANLLAQGYALAGTGFARQGWAVPEGVEAVEGMIRHVNGGGVKGTKRVVTWGSSLGGLISAAVAERNPKKVAGVLPLCGAMSGPEQLLSGGMTALFAWKSLVAPTLKIANYAAGPAGYAQAMGDLRIVLGSLSAISAGQVNPTSLSPVGYPYLQSNMLGALMAGLPTKSEVYDGQTLNPAIVEQFGGNPSAASAAGFSPVSAGASTAVGMLQNIGSAAALGILARYELEQRARAALSLAPTDNANFNDNVNVRYTRLLSPEQRGEFGDILNANPLVPNLLNAMLAKVDSTVGDASFRYPANPAVVNWVRNLIPLKGTYNQPIVMMTTAYDAVTPEGNQGMYTTMLEASYKKQGKKAGLNKIVSVYTVPSEDGYTKFAPGGRAPDAAASVAANISGVGHCQFMKTADGIQLTNAVTTLNRLMNAKTQKQVAAARRLAYNTPGVNSDRDYAPEPLKRPLLAR
jgi:pimeloyl-ACP methyl ester carboxylesterase